MTLQNTDEYAIICQNLCKNYADIEALKNLDLQIPKGSIFGFLGRNGAGKTTTIRLLTGLAHPTSGSAWVGGVETTNGESNAREQFGYLPQHPAFYGWMTPREYLDYVGGIFGMPLRQRKQKIAEVLQLTGLEKAAKRRISGFSGGMFQRLGIAQAVLHDPPVLFLDEPTSALDPAGRYELLELIDSLRGSVTVFLSSHILADIERICDLIGVIHEGELLFVSEREELLKRYQTNALLLQFDPLCLPLPQSFLEKLRGQSWLSSLQAEKPGELRLAVSDVQQTKKDLLPLITAAGLLLNSYQWVNPSLEEIFLEVSA